MENVMHDTRFVAWFSQQPGMQHARMYLSPYQHHNSSDTALAQNTLLRLVHTMTQVDPGPTWVQCLIRFIQIEPWICASAHTCNAHGIPLGRRLVDVHCYSYPGWMNPLQPTSVCGLATIRVQPGCINNACRVDVSNPDSTWIQPKFKH